MINPELNRSESIRLINEIGMSDMWMALTFDMKSLEFRVHGERPPDELRVLMAAYVMSDEILLNSIKEKL